MHFAQLRPSLIAVSAVMSLALGAAEALAADAGTPATPIPKAQSFKVGSFTAFSVEDGGIQEANDGKSFVLGQPVTEVTKVLKSGGAPGDHFEFDIHPLLVRTDKRVLLFDTGLGSYGGPQGGKLPQSMSIAGISPSSVTDIFISHAHGDHVGGLVTAAGALEFPNASIHISTVEWKYLSGMKDEDAKNVGITDVKALVSAIRPKVVAFEPGATIVPDVVKAVELKGHTPGHTGYEIGSGSDSVLYIGDAMHNYVVSVGKPMWKVAFDMDQDAGAASRVALDKRVAASGQRVFAVHFPFPGIGKIVQQNGGYVWVPEALH